MTHLDQQYWRAIEDILEEKEGEHDHIPFMDFSSFPVALNNDSNLELELANFENGRGELCTNHHLMPCNWTKSTNHDEFSMLAESEKYSIRNPGNIALDQTNGFPSPLTSDLDPKVDDLEFPAFQNNINVKNRHRFKPMQEEKWNHRFKEFREFVKENGHAAVPIVYPKNPKLARWVKRQRQQYKLRQELQTSTMTAERIELLSSVGFVWDSQDANWGVKLDALKEFHRKNGHCNVPRKFKENSLGVWIKIQRRQYKLYKEGRPSHMTAYRIEQLEELGFEF